MNVFKVRLDVHVLPNQEAVHVPRDGAGIGDPYTWLTPLAPSPGALEPTGGFETVVATELDGAGLLAVVVNPGEMRGFAQAPGQRAKTEPSTRS